MEAFISQFYSKAASEISNIEDKIENGNTTELLNWLREKIHIQGKRYSAKDLCVMITGEELSFKYFMEYAVDKYSKIYGVNTN